MVENSREKAGAGAIHSLNQPILVQVEENEHRRPTSVELRGRRVGVVSVADVWEIADEWWRASPIARRYYRVVVEGGATVNVFRDLVDGSWYAQQV